jgi:hypothetical protein
VPQATYSNERGVSGKLSKCRKNGSYENEVKIASHTVRKVPDDI